MLIVTCNQSPESTVIVLGQVDTKEAFVSFCETLGLKAYEDTGEYPAHSRPESVLMWAPIPMRTCQTWLELEEIRPLNQEKLPAWFRALMDVSELAS